MNNKNTIINTINLSEFENVFTQLIWNKPNFFGYFYGGYDDNGQSWCGDCVVAKPIIEEASKLLESQNNIIFLKFPVNERLEWKKNDFIFRTHPKVKLDRIPTLIYYQNGVEFARLIEGELFDKANVEDFIRQSLE
jgi:thiol-disulfide isomerase/thioredoxin